MNSEEIIARACVIWFFWLSSGDDFFSRYAIPKNSVKKKRENWAITAILRLLSKLLSLIGQLPITCCLGARKGANGRVLPSSES